MRRQQRAQSSDTGVPQSNRAPESAHGARQVVSPYLTSKEAVSYLRLRTLSALYHHVRQNGLPTCRVGGDLRFDTRELDAWLRGADTRVPTITARKRLGLVKG